MNFEIIFGLTLILLSAHLLIHVKRHHTHRMLLDRMHRQQAGRHNDYLNTLHSSQF